MNGFFYLKTAYLSEKPSAASLELFTRPAETRLLHGRQRHGRVDKIPAAADVDENRPFAVAAYLAVLPEMCHKFHLRMVFADFGNVRRHIQPQPLRRTPPFRHPFHIQQMPLARYRRFHEISRFLQNICAVTRAHQFLCGGGIGSVMKKRATSRVGLARLARAKFSIRHLFKKPSKNRIIRPSETVCRIFRRPQCSLIGTSAFGIPKFLCSNNMLKCNFRF